MDTMIVLMIIKAQTERLLDTRGPARRNISMRIEFFTKARLLRIYSAQYQQVKVRNLRIVHDLNCVVVLIPQSAIYSFAYLRFA